MSGQRCENYDVGKQFTITHEMLNAVARDQSMQLKVAWCCRWNLSAFFKISFCFDLLYNESRKDGAYWGYWNPRRKIGVATHFSG